MKNILYLAIFLPLMLFNVQANEMSERLLKEGDNHIYLNSPANIANMQTATYVVAPEYPDTTITQTLFDYAEKIGYSNGAVILTSNDKILYEYISKSECDFQYSKGHLIVFEDRMNEKCFYFHIEDLMSFHQVLGKIYGHIEDSKDLDKAIAKEKTNAFIDSLLAEYDMSSLSTSIKDFINFIIDKVFE